jgi:hypothetical protein
MKWFRNWAYTSVSRTAADEGERELDDKGKDVSWAVWALCAMLAAAFLALAIALFVLGEKPPKEMQRPELPEKPCGQTADEALALGCTGKSEKRRKPDCFQKNTY